MQINTSWGFETYFPYLLLGFMFSSTDLLKLFANMMKNVPENTIQCKCDPLTFEVRTIKVK